MDENLLFLENCSNEQLKSLADILVYDRDGKKRFSESLSDLKVYVNNYPNNIKEFLPQLVEEFRKFGSNAFLNLFKDPKSYYDILGDVCGKLKVPYREGMPVELIEEQMLQTLVFMSVKDMDEKDIKDLLNQDITKAEFLKSEDLLIVGSPIFIKILTTLVIQLSSKMALQGLGIWAARFAASRWFTVLVGPIGLAVGGLWTAYDIAGPAYRVTIPFVVSVAYYRMMSGKSKEEIEASFEE